MQPGFWAGGKFFLSSVRRAGKRGDALDDLCPGILVFNLLGLLARVCLQRLQNLAAAESRARRTDQAVPPDSSFNTAVSFATNTNWQGYGGETTMSYLTQMLGLTVQNFVSAATGMAVLVALIRGLARRSRTDHRQLLGRSGAHCALHPAAVVSSLALVLVSQGVVQTLRPIQRPAGPATIRPGATGNR